MQKDKLVVLIEDATRLTYGARARSRGFTLVKTPKGFTLYTQAQLSKQHVTSLATVLRKTYRVIHQYNNSTRSSEVRFESK